MSKIYPRWKYHKTEKAKVVYDTNHENKLGDEWRDSLAEFGIETHPGRHAFIESSSIEEQPKRRGRPAKAKE